MLLSSTFFYRLLNEELSASELLHLLEESLLDEDAEDGAASEEDSSAVSV